MSRGTELQEGEELRAVYVSGETTIRAKDDRGFGDADRIEVVLECGQMSYVPWAAVYENGSEQCRYNLALCLGVETKRRHEPPEDD